MTPPAHEIQPADPALRRLFPYVVIAVVVFGAVVVKGFEVWLAAHAGEADAVVRAGWVVVAAATLAPAGAALYLLFTAGRVRAARRFPPPGMRLLRDTPVRTGDAALRVAAWMLVGAMLLGIGALGVPYLFWRLASLLR